VLATLIMIALFFAGMVPAKAAIIIGGLLLLTRLVKSRRIYEEIDWSLLLASLVSISPRPVCSWRPQARNRTV
jgi:hypothetical protein